MLFVRLSPNRVFIFNEYWVLVPLVLAIDIAIIVKVKKNRAKKAEEENKLYSQKCTRYKMFHLASDNLLAVLQIRGGEDFVRVVVNAVENYVEIQYPNCIVGKGLRYVNSHRLRQIAYNMFKNKARNGVVFITKSALCHLAETYGINLPPVPIPAAHFVGISSWYTFMRKVVSVGVLGLPLPMMFLAQGPLSVVGSVITTAFGILSVYYTKDSGFTFIPTNLISDSISVDEIGRRIPDLPDLVSVDLESDARIRIMMPEFASRRENTPYECLLPGQMISNPRCTLRPTEIASVSSTASVLEYENVVNMKDMTQLHKVEFSDRHELLTGKKPNSRFRLRGMAKIRKTGKTVNFLDKFADPRSIPDSETWDATIPKNIPKTSIKEL